MASLIPGYENDIFVSYRQKDNKGDRWVSEFVDALKTELESTFKEEISVYFDINPHDGLLETHDVNASLKEKLKCLVFIPIISQTYCDSKSFAWQHEFVAFNKMAKEDQFGRDIRLAGGNVASRILPIKINDLDQEDKTLLENELGGVLRSIEFIYKAPGVNRPLNPSDNPDKNLNKTYYRDQINKVANAVKEIIGAIKKHSQQGGEVPKEVVRVKPNPQKTLKPLFIMVSAIILALIVPGYFFISKLSRSSDPVEKTIAVLPFQDLSKDSAQSVFCEGFMAEILNDLQEVRSFTIRSGISSDHYRNTKKSSITIGNELNADYLVAGSVGREGDNLKIWIKLIDSKADKQIWAHDYPGKMNQQFSLQSEIAKDIAAQLKATLSPDEVKKIEKRPSENPEAYDYYTQGNYYFKASGSTDNRTSIALYQKATRLDPGFALAFTRIAICMMDQYWSYEDHTEDILYKSKLAIDKAMALDPDLPDAHLALGIYYYRGFAKYPEALKEFEKILEDQPKNSDAIFWSACVHRRMGDWEAAKSEFEKAVELDPGRSDFAEDAGETFELLRNYSRAEEFYNKAIVLQPDYILPYPLLSQMYLRWERDTRKAREILGNAARNNKASLSDSLVIETNMLIDIYEGKYEEALKEISNLKYDVIQTQFNFNPKYLYYATIYGLMSKHDLEHACYDSARISLESEILKNPDDSRLFSSLGIVYAGLGLKGKAIEAGEKGVELMPINKEAYRGVSRVEDLARIYVMVGNYDDAIKQINDLLSIPGLLTTKILELDPRWAPLRNQPEFKKLIEKYSKSFNRMGKSLNF